MMRPHVAAVSHVQVPGQQHVDVTLLHLVQRPTGAVNDAVHALPRRRDERVMRDYDFENARRQVAGAQLHVQKLLLADPPVLPEAVEGKRERPGRVDADDQQFLVHKDRPNIPGDVFVVIAQRETEAGDDIKERDVMIPRHHQLRSREPGHVPRRRRVLTGTRTLGEVSAHHQQRRVFCRQLARQRLHHRRIDPIKVQVGDVRDGSHGAERRGQLVSTVLIRQIAPRAQSTILEPRHGQPDRHRATGRLRRGRL